MAVIVGEKAGRFVVSWDEGKGLARLDLSGFWSADDSRDLMPSVTEVVRRSRERHHGRAITLVDFTTGLVAPVDLIAAFATSPPAFVRPGDKVALVFTSALLRGQIKRVQSDELEAGYFKTAAEAEAWLLS